MKTSQEDKRQTSEPKSEQDSANVNVTLQGQSFPCPLCGLGLPLKSSRKAKPYCICDLCGIQIFFRGKRGIARLQELVDSGSLILAKEPSGGHATTLYNRLEQLKGQKQEMERKQGLFFRDEDLGNAIQTVDAEIQKAQSELEKMARKSRKEQNK